MPKIIRKVHRPSGKVVAFWANSESQLCACHAPEADKMSEIERALLGWEVHEYHAAYCGTTLAEIRKELEEG